MSFLREKLSLNQMVLLLLIVVALSSSLFSFFVDNADRTAEWWSGWSQNFSTEVFGAIMTFALFELLVGRQKERDAEARKIEELKARLVREARSSVNNVAVQAINELQEYGWLQGEDGLLKRAQLSYANLVGADLGFANLVGADLGFANLVGADLEYANLTDARLEKANLTGANLHFAKFNEKTILPDAAESIGTIDMGKFTLVWDKYWTPDTDMTRYTDPNHPDFWQPEWVKEQNKGE